MRLGSLAWARGEPAGEGSARERRCDEQRVRRRRPTIGVSAENGAPQQGTDELPGRHDGGEVPEA